MSAAVVLGYDLDVFVLFAPMKLVLDAEIGEVDLIVEVWQVVLVRPAFDLARVAIGPAVAIGASAVGRLQPLLIIAFELLVEHDATDVGALFAEAICFT